MRHISSRLFLSSLLATLAFAVQAHHSFAVHFIGEPEGMIEVSGVVDGFRFSNPHGILSFTVTGEDGEAVAWRAETNSPSVLRRRGWSQDSLQAGDAITVLGFPSRDGSAYMRVSRITFSDGRELLGQAAAAPVEEQD